MASKPNIDIQINTLLEKLNPRQKKAVLSVVKTFAKEQDEAWEAKDYLAEMGNRMREIEEGIVKTVSLEDLEKRARKSYSRQIK
jgi:hypothetical protein